jgi:hypothetical protein
MQLLPSESDKAPIQNRYWVNSVAGGIVPTEIVSETPEAVATRLEHDFPLYHAYQVGKKALAGLIAGSVKN